MNIFKFIKNHAKHSPSKIAISDGETQFTYVQLYKALSYGQKKVEDMHLTSNSYVILKESNQLEFILQFLSVLAAGLGVVPVGREVVENELKEIEKATGATYLTENLTFSNTDGDENEELKIPDENKVGILHRTSGSTGESKYCVRSLATLTEEGLNFTQAYSIVSEDRVLSTCPLYHAYALGAAFMSTLVIGCSLYTMDGFKPRETLKKMREFRITYLVLVADTARILCIATEKKVVEYKDLRIALVGASAIDEELYENFYNRFKIYLSASYGSTETGGAFSREKPGPYNSIGKPMNNVSIRLKNGSGRQDELVGEGELWIKSNTMLSSYWHEELNKDDEGYISMGDIVGCDSKEMYYVKGRTKSILKIGGNSINTKMVEKIILKNPYVKDCVVYASQNVEGKQLLKAAIVGPEINIELLREFCKANMPPYMIPSIISIKDKIKRNEMGKIIFKDL